jgi:protein-S-isoprenylcysteine O-methyltransferase Ste14
MSAESALPISPRLALALDLAERTFSLFLFIIYMMRMARILFFRPWDGVAVIAEALVMVFVVTRRRASALTLRPLDWLVGLVGTVAPMLVRPGGDMPAAPVIVFCFGLMTAGLLFSLWGKLILRRSFGLVAANRGVVSTGAYAFVRHPIYFGYILIYIGFLTEHHLIWNAAVYAAAVGCMTLRVRAEERILMLDPAYQAYAARVRWRMIPGVI